MSATKTAAGESLPAAPTELAEPSQPGFNHKVLLDVPMPSQHLAQTLYRAISVDRVLRPSEAFVAYSVPLRSSEAQEDAIFQAAIYATTVRVLRLSVNSVIENITLIVETMQAFAPGYAKDMAGSAQQRNGAAIIDTKAASLTTGDIGVNAASAEEFELNGTGRAG